MFSFYIVCFLLRVIHSRCEPPKDIKDEVKRLLINDPDAIAARLTHLEQQNQKLTEIVTRLDTATPKDYGATYIRWGRTVCEGPGTELVYKGYAAGQNYYNPDSTNYRGGPADYLCLPDHPQITNITFSETDSLLYGTEYERNHFASNSANEDMPCALCRKTSSTSVVMIPGRKLCFPGWNLEYSGILGSGSRGHSASRYICVDNHPEFMPSGHPDLNGHLVYAVGYKCGPLPCPPYADNRIANCVVCSK